MSLTEEIEKLQRFDIVYDFGDTYVGGQEDGEYLNRDKVLELVESYVYDEDDPEDYELSPEEIAAKEKRYKRLREIADLSRHIQRIDNEEQAKNFIRVIKFHSPDEFLLASALSERVSDYYEEEFVDTARRLGRELAAKRTDFILQEIK